MAFPRQEVVHKGAPTIWSVLSRQILAAARRQCRDFDRFQTRVAHHLAVFRGEGLF